MGKKEDKLKGGYADSKSVTDVVKKDDVPVKNISKELNMGIKIEMEHDTKDSVITESVDELDVKNFWDKLKSNVKNIGITANRERKNTMVALNILKKVLNSPNKISDSEKNFIKGQSGNLAKIIGVSLSGAVSMIIPITIEKILNKWDISILPKDQLPKLNNEFNMNEQKILIKKLLREAIDLSLSDETNNSKTLDIYYNKRKAGHITCGPASANVFDEDTHEILELYLDNDYTNLNVANQAINALWIVYPDVNRFVISLPEKSQLFWEKLGFTRLNDNYHMLFRGH